MNARSKKGPFLVTDSGLSEIFVDVYDRRKFARIEVGVERESQFLWLQIAFFEF